MRVLLLNQFFPPDSAPTARLAGELAEDLAKAGIEVTEIAGEGPYLDGRVETPRAIEGVTLVRVRTLRNEGGPRLGRVLAHGSYLLGACAELPRLPRPDVILAMSTPPFLGLAGLLGKALRGARLVHWIQDLYPDVAVAAGVLRPRSPLTLGLKAATRRLLGRCDRLVVLGSAMRERVLTAGASPDRVVIVPNWVSGRSGAPRAPHESMFRSSMMPGSRFVVMYLGNFGVGHDVRTLLDAATKLSSRADIGFLFVGHGAKWPQTQAACRSLPNVRCVGALPNEALADALAAGDVHLGTLSAEFLGLMEPSKVLGAIGASRPVLFVGPAASECARIVSEEGCGFVIANGASDALADAIVRMADDPALVSKLADRASAAARGRCSRSRATAQFRTLLEEAG